MTLDQSFLLPGLFGIILSCLSWWINTTWAKVQSLSSELGAAKADLANFKTEVARDCVAKADLEKITDRIFDKLDEVGKELNHISRNQAQVKTLADALRDVRRDRDGHNG